MKDSQTLQETIHSRLSANNLAIADYFMFNFDDLTQKELKNIESKLLADLHFLIDPLDEELQKDIIALFGNYSIDTYIPQALMQTARELNEKYRFSSTGEAKSILTFVEHFLKVHNKKNPWF